MVWLDPGRVASATAGAVRVTLAMLPTRGSERTAKDRWVNIRRDIDASTKDSLRMSSYEIRDGQRQRSGYLEPYRRGNRLGSRSLIRPSLGRREQVAYGHRRKHRSR